MNNKCDCYLNDESYFYYLTNGINDLFHWSLRENLPKDYTEITYEQFKKYVLKQENNNMEKKIIRYKLKDDCKQYLSALDKISSYFSRNDDYSFPVNCTYYYDYKQAGVLNLWFEPIYEEEFKVGDWIKVQYTNGDDSDEEIAQLIKYLPQEYIKFIYSVGRCSHARLATPEEIAKYQTKELYFGDVKFTIKNGNDYAETAYGKVTKEEIKYAIDYIENPPKLALHTLTIFNTKNRCPFDWLDERKDLSYGFGCKAGKLSELKAIYQAFE